ncbi:MAG: hypothetical protein ABIY38_08105 [Rhodococcus sp. (in: high G+C Gram-positive bacteria)]
MATEPLLPRSLDPAHVESSDRHPHIRRTGVLSALARIPLPVIGALLVLGALLVDLQLVWIALLAATGEPDPPQWVAHLTIMQFNIIIPLALIALWARRRSVQGRLGAIAAGLMAVLPIVHVFMTVCAIVWGGILQRGSMQLPFMYIEYGARIAYLGLVLSGLSWILDREASRLIGPLIVAGILVGLVVPGAITVFYIALAVVIVRSGVVRTSSVASPSPAVS